jgi:hypothetical protein
MQDKKRKTEIVIGFTHHTPSFVDKELENMKKADVILFEAPTHNIEQLKEGIIQPQHLGSISSFPDTAERTYRALKKLSDDGKIVLGYENYNNPKIWSREERAKLHELEEKTERYFFKTRAPLTKRYFLRSARASAEATKLRDKNSFEWIKQNLPKFEGKKVYIMAGSGHTGLYHLLKKELEPKGISIKTLFLSKGLFKNPRMLEKYTPYTTMMRTIIFNTPSSRDKKATKEHLRLTKEYVKKVFKQTKRYMKEMPWELAQEKADLEFLTAERKRRKR